MNESWEKPRGTRGRNFKLHEGYVVVGSDRNRRPIYLHRLVIEKELGRCLMKEEHVHHKDGDRANNIRENLELVSHKEHIKRHGGWGRAIR